MVTYAGINADGVRNTVSPPRKAPDIAEIAKGDWKPVDRLIAAFKKGTSPEKGLVVDEQVV